ESIRGIACDEDVTTLTVEALRAPPQTSAELLAALGAAGIRCLLVVRSSDAASLSVVVARDAGASAAGVLRPLVEAAGGTLRADEDGALVTAVGHAVHSHPETVGRVLGALAAGSIVVRLVASSAISVACVVPRPDVSRAAALLHEKMGLDRATAPAR